MLTTNIHVEKGLYNGSVGITRDILYKPGEHPTKQNQPTAIMVTFPKYTGESFIEDPKVVPIVPVKRRLDCGCCTRTQIPLRLGWGTTIHRCQGLTIGSGEVNRYIVIAPGSKSFESRNPGALYVALSRAKTAGDGTTDPDFAFNSKILLNEDRLQHKVNTPTTRARSTEIQRIKALTEHTKQEHAPLNIPQAFTQITEEISKSYQNEE